jgi:hypothetical protein
MDTLFYILGGLVAWMMISNSKSDACTKAYYLVDVNGKSVTDPTTGAFVAPYTSNPCSASFVCNTVMATKRPSLSCLLNPFPGGL